MQYNHLASAMYYNNETSLLMLRWVNLALLQKNDQQECSFRQPDLSLHSMYSLLHTKSRGKLAHAFPIGQYLRQSIIK